LHLIHLPLTALIPLTWHPVRVELASLFVAMGLAQYFAEPWLRKIERAWARLALRKGSVIVGVAMISIVARLALLPLDPVPIPAVHDEFSYLLAGDTFAHGRLANPPHLMWAYLETFHELGHPTYASIYPPAQGLMLALGQLLGNPWIGVLLSAAAMCAAVAWALQGWLPARWALLGSLFALARVGLMSYWVDSYWGGALAAIGGALVIGALPRVLRRGKLRDAFLLGLGAVVLANSRPFEGVIFCAPVAIILVIRFLRGRADFRLRLAKTLSLAAFVLGFAVVFMSYYNWRVTGSALVFPHVLINRQLGEFPVFVWQHAKPPLTYDNPQFTTFFVGWSRERFLQRSWAQLSLDKCRDTWRLFLGPLLSIPFVMLPWLVFDRRIPFLLIQFVWCGIWLSLVPYFEPHYVAPLTVTIFSIVTQAMRHLRQFNLKGYRVGTFASRIIVVLVVAKMFSPSAERVATPGLAPRRTWNLARAQIAEGLTATPEKHLIIVHYSPEHVVHYEWVYNAADIDGSKVVWARYVPGRDLKPLLDYYHDRKIWVVEADADHPQLEPYSAKAIRDTR
jgi:hypothetical protein